MAYVKIDKDLCDDWRIFALANLLLDEWVAAGLSGDSRAAFRGAARNALLGGLYRLWRYADTHLVRHDRLKLALQGLEEVTQLPVTVLGKFPAEWLTVHDDGTIELPGYALKNSLIDRDDRREQTRERVRRFRQRQRDAKSAHRKRSGNSNGVTSASPPVPVPVPGTGPLDRTGTVPGKSRENSASLGGELASAAGRLARRETPPEQIERKRREADALHRLATGAKP